MRSVLPILFTFCVAYEFGTIGYAGNVRGNGADKAGWTSAWFLDPERPIRYCMRVHPKFGVARVELRRVVEATYQQWLDYVEQKGPLRIYDLEKFFAKRLEYEARCRQDTDLTFYFGIKTRRVKKALAGVNSADPLAFAFGESFDQDTGWGKGLIWLDHLNKKEKFQWSQERALWATILHEWGHVFGCEHANNTVMSSFLYGFMNVYVNHEKGDILYGIDHGYELFHDPKSGFSFSGILRRDFDPPGRDVENFRLLFGREPDGMINASVWQARDGDAKFMVSDSLETLEFELVVHERTWITSVGISNMFFARRKIKDRVVGAGEFHKSHVVFGELHTSGQKVLDVVISRNMGFSKFSLSYLKGSARVILFSVPWF